MAIGPHGGVGLAQLLGTDPTEFFDVAWERAPRLARGVLQGVLDEVLTLDEFEVFIAGMSAGLSIVDGQVARPVSPAASGRGQRPSVYEAYGSGCTVLLQGLQLRSRPIAQICRAVENEVLRRGIPLAEGVSANGYLTPVLARGFDLHYDNHCAIVVQVHGTKDWTIFAPVDELPIARCEHPIARGDLGPPLIETTLAPGDVLYIPRGFPHCASTAATSSLHVTLSLRTLTWAELISAMCQEMAVFRRSVGPGDSTTHAPQAYFESDLLPRLAHQCVGPLLHERVQACVSRLGAIPSGRLRAIDDARQINADTIVARVPLVHCAVSAESGMAVLRFPDAALRLPAAMEPVFAFIASHDEFGVHDLPAIDATYDPVELTRILVRRGLLYVKHQLAAPTAWVAAPVVSET